MTTTGPIAFDVLVDYWLGELPAEREAEVEERLFEDAETAHRLDAIARMGEGIATLLRRGQVTATMTLDALDRLEAEGVAVRTYRVGPGETVPCTVADEALVAIRLHGVFEGVDEVDLELEARLADQPPQHERFGSLPVDRRADELVLVYAGDTIRSFPRSTFVYRITSRPGGTTRSLGEFRLDHTPPPG